MKYFEKVVPGKAIENMSKSPEKETPTAPPPSEITSSSAGSMISTPPAALKGYYQGSWNTHWCPFSDSDKKMSKKCQKSW